MHHQIVGTYLSCEEPRSDSSLALAASSLSASSSRVLSTAIWASLAAMASRVSASCRRRSAHVCSVCDNCRRWDSNWRWHRDNSDKEHISTWKVLTPHPTDHTAGVTYLWFLIQVCFSSTSAELVSLLGERTFSSCNLELWPWPWPTNLTKTGSSQRSFCPTVIVLTYRQPLRQQGKSFDGSWQFFIHKLFLKTSILLQWLSDASTHEAQTTQKNCKIFQISKKPWKCKPLTSNWHSKALISDWHLKSQSFIKILHLVTYRNQRLHFNGDIPVKAGSASSLSVYFLHLFQNRTDEDKWQRFFMGCMPSYHPTNSVRALKETWCTTSN